MQDQNLPNTPGNNTGAGANVPPMPPPGGAGVPPQAPGGGNPPVNLTQGGSPAGTDGDGDTKDDTDGVPQQTVSADKVGNIPPVPNTMDDLTNPPDPAGSGQSQAPDSPAASAAGDQPTPASTGQAGSAPNLSDQLAGNLPAGQSPAQDQAAMPVNDPDSAAASPAPIPGADKKEGGMQQSTVTGTQTPGEESAQPGGDNSLPPLPPSATGPDQSPGVPPAPAGSPTGDAPSPITPPDPLSQGNGGQAQVPQQ